MMRMLYLLYALALCLPTLLGAQTVSTDTDDTAKSPPVKLIVGVRNHVRPFAHFNSVLADANRSTKSGPLRAAGYEGYMIYICDEVFKEMSIAQKGSPSFDLKTQVEVREITPDQDRFNDRLGVDVDILCDPATITRNRVKRFAVSPPLFATGISFLSLADGVAPRQEKIGADEEEAVIGAVGKTTATDYGIDAILDSGEWGRYQDDVTSALRAEESDPEKFNDLRRGIIRSFDTHKDLAKAFCNRLVTYYVGDLEIISEYANRYPGCNWQRAPHSYTSDRYGIFAHMDYSPEGREKALLIGRFFEVLNREIATTDSLLDRAYLATFGSREKSQALELFYWSVRGVR